MLKNTQNSQQREKNTQSASIMLKTEDEYIGSGGGGGWRRGGVVCEACERSLAVFICKADAASLCAACDAEIHSANPLARRHHRVPITAVVPTPEDREDEEDEDEAASWLLMNPLKSNNNHTNNGLFLLGREEEEDDEYLNFVEFNGCEDEDDHQFEELKNYGVGGEGGDSVVPIEFEGKLDDDHEMILQQISYGSHQHHELFQSSSYNGFLTHTISVTSSMEVGVVPESTTTISDISISNTRPPKGTIDLFSGTVAVQTPATQLSPMDREARVLRYREKKKTRKFEKTIRYASRKAYAETRPRIKGRFAKRTDVDVHLDRKFSSPLMTDNAIVPSF